MVKLSKIKVGSFFLDTVYMHNQIVRKK